MIQLALTTLLPIENRIALLRRLIELTIELGENTLDSVFQAILDLLNELDGGLLPSQNPMRDLLLTLVNESVQITTPFDTITGTVLSVQNDYVALVDTIGNIVLVQFDKIELVSEL